MIAIIDYGMGNPGSIQNMLLRLGAPSIITRDHEEIRKAQRLVLPGVGAFHLAVQNIDAFGLRAILNDRVVEAGVPFLGICLGMQLLGKSSEEGLPAEGLGWFDAHTRKFDFSGLDRTLRLPHMGWNTLQVRRPHPVVASLPEEARFYFVHTYHVVCQNQEDVVAEARYGFPFTAMMSRGNILGAQFHPEKSHRFGMEIMKKFISI